MMFQLKNKSALVTGAATGLGQAIAIALARNGASVAISDKTLDSLQDTEAEIAKLKQQVISLAIDVRDLDQVRRGRRGYSTTGSG
jgi:NADP-dependent 3-hydroxy acid dehydrogenase YdfG